MTSTKRKAENLLRAANQPCIMKCRGSQADSERDSGFSDASSEHLSTMDTTDSEDSPHPVKQQGAQGAGSGQKPSQLSVVGGSYSGLSPMIIMNNVVLKQPVENPPALKPWGFSPTVEVVQPVVPQPQVVFLQPVVSRQGSSTSKEATSKHRRSKKYLPILKSYPKIAPHPGDSVGSSGRGSASSSSSSSSGSEKCNSLISSLWDQRQRQKVEKSLCSSSNNSEAASPSLPGTPSPMSPLLHSRLPLPAAENSSTVSPAKGKSAICSQSKNQTLALDSISSLEGYSSDGSSDTKRKRFCNTYNILSKSGLLDITLRTKELLRQNQSTQNELDQLKKHTDLFLQALQTGDTSVCMKLLSHLQEEDRERAAQGSLKALQT
ncbi:CLOCK-interacting pacemaker [Cyprinodon tularosa]|uniref:CLOCK-interacting pacemaker n=1 Tax=Cyprinodon tularosa TaxID=77115 RepID=UPI0018E23EA4|nr:CLOCK-interacting pacemaker [Cyprinodon tularosa]XP_038142006.1 CLOCK-interacting pacemaker [Cyprinodon tularosa]